MKYNDYEIMRFIQLLGCMMSEDVYTDCRIAVDTLGDCLVLHQVGLRLCPWQTVRIVRCGSVDRRERIA